MVAMILLQKSIHIQVRMTYFRYWLKPVSFSVDVNVKSLTICLILPIVYSIIKLMA